MGDFDQAFVNTYSALTHRNLQKAQLDEQKRLNDSRLKQMEAEEKLTQLQLESLATKMQAETRLPSQMAAFLGPQGAELEPGQQGPPVPPASPEIDRKKLGSFLFAAKDAGQDPDQLLNLMAISDPRIAAIQDELQPETFLKVGEGETVLGLKKTRQKPNVAVPSGQEQPIGGSEPVQGLQGQPTGQGIATPEPQASPMPAGARKVFTGPPKPEKPQKTSVEESKVVGELAELFPEKMATLQAQLGRPPTFNEAGQFFTPAEFAQSFRARETRQQEGRIEVAQQTGVDAAERQFQLAKQKEKIPEKPSAGERKAFTEDLVALNQSRNIIDKFDPAFVGPYQGRFGNINELIGTLGYDEAEFRGVVARTRNATIKAITGAQMGEPEATRIRQELPEFNLRPEAFIARMRLTYVNLYEMTKIRRQIAGETGIDISGLTPLAPPEEIDPQIREALRQQAGLTPVGAAQEKMQQGAGQQEEAHFLTLLPRDMIKTYQRLRPTEKARFKARYLQRIEALSGVQ